MDARERFEATREAVKRLHDVQLAIMYECDDWKPPAIKAHNEQADPTASRAIYRVDELSEKLEALREEERELTQLIGETLAIIAAVRDGFGDKYADVLEARYIDCEKWQTIADDYESNHKGKDKVKPRTVQNWAQVAFDWIDSVGVSRLLSGRIEL